MFKMLNRIGIWTIAIIAGSLMSGILVAGQGSSEREPNNKKNLSDAVKGLTISGSLDSKDTEDWFILNGQEGTKAKFVITHPSNCDFDFEVFSEDQSTGRAIGTRSGDSQTSIIPGTCYVRVWRVRGNGAYTIKIQPLNGGPPPRVGKQIENEPNNSRNMADPCNDMQINGTLDTTKDVDWFYLKGQEGVNPTFTITHGTTIDIDFEVFSDSKSVGRAVGTRTGDSITCKVPGKCYVKVWSARGYGNYFIVIKK